MPANIKSGSIQFSYAAIKQRAQIKIAVVVLSCSGLLCPVQNTVSIIPNTTLTVSVLGLAMKVDFERKEKETKRL